MISTDSTQATRSLFVVLGGDNPRILNTPPTIDQNCLVPIVVMASNQQAADSYYTYHQFLKSSYTDISSLCSDIDRAEREIGKIQGHFYPVARGKIDDQGVKMVYTSYPEIRPLFSSKTKRTFRKVTSLRDALVFMVANGDSTLLKDCKSWEKPEKPAVAQPDAAVASPPQTPQKKVDTQIPISPRTPSGKLRPKCKYCKEYMLGHDKVACNLKSASTIHSLDTTLSPSTKSSRRSVSPPTEEEESDIIPAGPSTLPMSDPGIHSGDPTLFLRLLRNLPTSRNVFAFDDIGSALSFQSEARKLRFHSALQVWSTPDTLQVTPIFVVVGESKDDVSVGLQECLRSSSQLTSALWPPATA